MKNPKTRNKGRWTEARYRQFIIAGLRHALQRWQPKHDVINASYQSDGINPATGRRCKLHLCGHCNGLFPKKDMRADHTIPIVDPSVGFTTYDEWIERAFVEEEEMQAICVGCHKVKSAEEREVRTQREREERERVNTAVRKRVRKAL